MLWTQRKILDFQQARKLSSDIFYALQEQKLLCTKGSWLNTVLTWKFLQEIPGACQGADKEKQPSGYKPFSSCRKGKAET